MKNKNDNHPNNKLNQKNTKNNENFFIRLFDIISIPFFVLLMIIILEDQLLKFDFYFEYALYIGLISGLISLLMYGLAGYIAKKETTKNIKPTIAGLSLGILIGIVSFTLTLFFTPDLSQLDNQINQENLDDQVQTYSIESETESNPFQIFIYIIGVIGIIFSGLIGMLFGFIGGKVAQ